MTQTRRARTTPDDLRAHIGLEAETDRFEGELADGCFVDGLGVSVMR